MLEPLTHKRDITTLFLLLRNSYSTESILPLLTRSSYFLFCILGNKIQNLENDTMRIYSHQDYSNIVLLIPV